MKLLLCHKCNDCFSLRVNEVRTCRCGRCGGQYVCQLDAEVWGEAPREYSVLGFSNASLASQIRAQIHKGDGDVVEMYGGKLQVMGRPFDAFIIPEAAPSVRREVRKAG